VRRWARVIPSGGRVLDVACGQGRHLRLLASLGFAAVGVDRDERKRIFSHIGLHDLKPVIPPERQLWIMAKDDVYISADLVARQWEEWGKPPIEWIPGGHMTFPLSIGRIIDRTRDFHAKLHAA